MQALQLRLAPAGRLGRLVWVRRAVVLVLLALLLLSVEDGRRVAQAVAAPTVSPRWTTQDALAFPRCRPVAAWPHARIPSALVVQRVADEGRSVRMPFDRAWSLNHDRTEVDDVLVLGACS